MFGAKSNIPTLFTLSTDCIINYELAELTRLAANENPDYARIDKGLFRQLPGKYMREDVNLDFDEYNKNTKFNGIKHKEFSQIVYHLFKNHTQILALLKNTTYVYSRDFKKTLQSHIPQYEFSDHFITLLEKIQHRRISSLNRIKYDCEYFNLDKNEVVLKCNLDSKIYINAHHELQQAIIFCHFESEKQINNKQFINLILFCLKRNYENVLLKIIRNNDIYNQLITLLNDKEVEIDDLLRHINNIHHQEIIDLLFPCLFDALKMRKTLSLADLIGVAYIYNKGNGLTERSYFYLKTLVNDIFSRSLNENDSINLSPFENTVYDLNCSTVIKLQQSNIEEYNRCKKTSLADFLIAVYQDHLIADPHDKTIINYVKSLFLTEEDKKKFVFSLYVGVYREQIENPKDEKTFSVILKTIQIDTTEMGEPDMDLVMSDVKKHSPIPQQSYSKC